MTAALAALERKPGERLAIYQRAKALFDRVSERRFDLEGAVGAEAKHARLLQSLGELDAILSVLPPEVRGKVGGYTVLANIGKDSQSGPRERTITKFFEKRIEMIGRELDTYLSREYRLAIVDMLERARPKMGDGNVRKSTLGPETQAFADKVYRASLMDTDKVSARLMELEAALEQASGDNHAALTEEWGIVNMFGDLEGRDAETLAEGFQTLKDQLRNGREAWRLKEQARIVKQREVIRKIVDGLGRATRAGRFEGSKNTSFEQLIRKFLPEDTASEIVAKSRPSWARGLKRGDRKIVRSQVKRVFPAASYCFFPSIAGSMGCFALVAHAR